MILKSDQIAQELETSSTLKEDRLIITPLPNLDELKKSGSASLDVHLGCWFLVCRPTNIGCIDIYDKNTEIPNESMITKSYYRPFGKSFILHPKTFVLGVTLEWFRFPANLAAYIVGRSSWGRYGLIIATATGVHPGFTGCLTLELSNVGEIPIAIKPGSSICQLFIHQVDSKTDIRDNSHFIGRRKPILGTLVLDDFALKLSKNTIFY